MSATGGEKRKPLEKWAFRGVCPPKFGATAMRIIALAEANGSKFRDL